MTPEPPASPGSPPPRTPQPGSPQPTLRPPELRPPELQDFPALAALLTASNPGWPQTAADLRHDRASRDPALYQRQWLAEIGGALVGAATLQHDSFAAADWRYSARLDVQPAARGQGVGERLHRALLADLHSRGAREVSGMLGADDAAGLAFLTRRGWRETWRRHEFRRAVGVGEALPAPQTGALRLRPLAEVLRGDPQHAGRLYALDTRLHRDIPALHRETPRPPEVWARQELHDPLLRPALSFVLEDPALLEQAAGDPQSGPYVGYTTLGRNPGGFHFIGMTGVLPHYRGRGLARALKLAAMRALAAAGGSEIRTWNDPPNAAMIHVNRALGFVPQPDRVRYTLSLDQSGAGGG